MPSNIHRSEMHAFRIIAKRLDETETLRSDTMMADEPVVAARTILELEQRKSLVLADRCILLAPILARRVLELEEEVERLRKKPMSGDDK